jgi:hypothetical protein
VVRGGQTPFPLPPSTKQPGGHCQGRTASNGKAVELWDGARFIVRFPNDEGYRPSPSRNLSVQSRIEGLSFSLIRTFSPASAGFFLVPPIRRDQCRRRRCQDQGAACRPWQHRARALARRREANRRRNREVEQGGEVLGREARLIKEKDGPTFHNVPFRECLGIAMSRPDGLLDSSAKGALHGKCNGRANLIPSYSTHRPTLTAIAYELNFFPTIRGDFSGSYSHRVQAAWAGQMTNKR